MKKSVDTHTHTCTLHTHTPSKHMKTEQSFSNNFGNI